MKPNKDLSNAMFVHSFIRGDVFEFDEALEQYSLSPLLINGERLVVDLNQEERIRSRTKYGNNYVGFEVAKILMINGIFHLHKNVLIKNEFTEMIFQTRVGLYVRP